MNPEYDCVHVWIEGEVYCEDCGTHPGLYCDLCLDTVDFIFEQDPRGES